jgi:hypothetical protein
MRMRIVPSLFLTACLVFGAVQFAGAQVVREIPRTPPWHLVSPSPGPGYRWVAGHWRWNGRRYAWISGHYALPPYPGAHWVNGHWQRVDKGWQYVDGYWSPSQESSAVEKA